ARNLPFADGRFDAVFSISVIEHIPGRGDEAALREMWRVLRSGGRLIITIPFLPRYWEEYVDDDWYGLNSPNLAGQFFASRYYDAPSIQSRIYHVVGQQPEKIEIFGETEVGEFFALRARGWKAGLEEAVKEPYYIATQFKRYETFDAVVGLAVVGLVFRKPSSRPR
ncbi:MAG TPA: class I SAM-dependent methyltransferase, partial [Terriglobales bacterium]|nr:class I SAM-dependent methyltransferase [Terriglobales bacterium]